MSGPEARRLFRSARYRDHTAGFSFGLVQGNIVILPAAEASDFARFCLANPAACPVVGVSEVGDPTLPLLGVDIDIRTDVPAYRVYRQGRDGGEVTDISDLWRDDMVTFVLGCSFSFEQALSEAGYELDHIVRDRTVAMYRTRRNNVAAGPFGDYLVVSMRPIPETAAQAITDITRAFPYAHGAPVHIGDPAVLGIKDLDSPDWGQSATFRPGDVPAFWACGVTPQSAIMAAGLELCITHSPGRMLITDLPAGEPAMAAWKAAQHILEKHGRLSS
jgi:uncharacterized protein YcsI (UPF0317 family)